MTRMAMAVLAIWSAVLAGSVAFSQTPSLLPAPAKWNATNLPLGDLREEGTIQFSAPAPILMDPNARCDQRGNLYLVYGDNARDRPDVLPIRRLSPESQSVVEYKVPQEPGYQSEYRLGWDASPWGTVYALLSCRRHSPPQPQEFPDYLVAKFKDDGTVDSVTKLEQPKEGFIRFDHVAAFAHGGFLLTGNLAADHQGSPRPFTGVYREDGRLLREVELTDFVGVAAGSVHLDGGSAHENSLPTPLFQAFWAALMGELAAGLDGDLYSLRATSPPVLYKISPDGALAKEIKLQFDSSGLEPLAFSLPAHGGAYIVFGRSSSGNPMEDAKYHTILALVDPETGAITSAFRMPGEGRLMSSGCITDQGQFLFPGATEAGKLKLVKYARR